MLTAGGSTKRAFKCIALGLPFKSSNFLLSEMLIDDDFSHPKIFLHFFSLCTYLSPNPPKSHVHSKQDLFLHGFAFGWKLE